MSTNKKSEIQLKAIEKENVHQIKERDPKYLERDISFIQTLVQGAVNVELFTIPLYMTSMYSIVGMHQINSEGTNFYEGRWWPGSAPSATPDTTNKKAFNAIFSVFMEEMLHLQLASNMAAKLGVKPSFTSGALQSTKNAWTCYGTTDKPSSVIPHILDFKDFKESKKNFNKIKVKIGALDKNQINLFLAVEEDNALSKKYIKTKAWKQKYEHQAPYNDWKTCYTEGCLPLFGSIGKMYETLWAYIEIEYTDGTSLLGKLLEEKEVALQRDEFNTKSGSGLPEYPGVQAKMSDNSPENILKIEFLNMINAITDQGEGKGVMQTIFETWDEDNTLSKGMKASKDNGILTAVQKRFQPSAKALKMDYKGYNDEGNSTPISGQAKARINATKLDHYASFKRVQKLMKKDDFLTWDKWHAQGQTWSKEMLEKKVMPESKIPSGKEVAYALNELKRQDEKNENEVSNYTTLSLTAVGTLKGVTTTLNDYWSKSTTGFPSPAMVGSGDRISICWAITGQAPDLSLGINHANNNVEMFNGCQGMSLMKGEIGKDTMPDVRIYHSCKGSNECKTQGGCGFVESTKGGGSGCSSSGCGANTKKDLKSAPGNNTCGGKGGCSVPISASQLFPSGGTMEIHSYGNLKDDFKTTVLDTKKYAQGDAVYDIAWDAYSAALKAKGKKVQSKPKPSLLRVAFPPST